MTARIAAVFAVAVFTFTVEPAAARAAAYGGAPRAWEMQRHRLQVQTGVSGAVTAVSAVIGLGCLIALSVPLRPSEDCSLQDSCGGVNPYEAGYTAAVALPIAVIAAIPTAVFGVRLVRHMRLRPMGRIQLGPGGLLVRF